MNGSDSAASDFELRDPHEFNTTLLTATFAENVSEHLQVQGLEVQDSHNEIAKDLADVRHQAQDIYQKLGNRNVWRVHTAPGSNRGSLSNQTAACWSSCSTSTRRLSSTVT